MGYVLVNDDYKISDAALAGIDTASRYGKWYSYNKKVDFNTLQKDLEAVNQDVVAAYEGWQTQEKMKNIKSSAENMYNRLISLQEYNQLTNAANTEYIDAMVSDYKTVLESWDDRASIYGNYKNAEAYKTDLNNYIFGQQFRVKTGVDKETGEDIYRGYTYAEVQAELEKYEVGSDEYNYLKKYIGYTDLNEFDKAIEKENTSGIAKKVRDTERKKAGYDLRALNSRRGFSDVKNFITNGLSGNSVLNNIYRLPAYQPSAIAVLTDDTANETTTAEGNALITFEQVLKATEDTANETTTAEGNGLLTFEQMLKASEDKANAKAAYEKAVLNPSLAIDDYDWLLSKAKSTQEVIDSLKKTDEYKYYEDLEEARNQWELDHRADYYKHYMENEDFEEKSQYVSTVKDWDTYGLEVDGQYEYINNSFVVAGTMYTIGASTEEIRYKYLNEDEVKIYNYLYSTKGKDAAQDFLDNMEITLGYRDNVAMGKRLEAIADNPIGAVVGSVASVPLNIIGGTCSGIGNFVDWVFGEEYNPYADYNTLSNAVSSFRGYVSENIAEATEGFELLGTNVPSFLYDTGMSMADSALGAYTLGAHSSLIMGANAYQQKAKELYEAGEDEYTVSATAFATGFSEVLFEYVSIDKLLKIKDVDSISSLLKSGAKQAGIEASEEFFTELSNIIADDVIRGDSSELAQMARELRGKGYSESEINAELAKHIGSKLAWASIGGALSGGVMGSASSTKAYLNAKSIGNTISASNGINELLNMASLSSEESNSFNLYTVYVQKGINAKNITNAQIGIIYNALNTDTLNTLFSKTTTVAQKRNALTNQTKLQKISQRASISTDTMTAIDHALSMQEAYRANLNNLINTGISFKNTSKAYKLAKSCEQKISDGETITDSEINNLVNEIAIVRTEEYIENLPQKELFEKFYNKNTDVISFVNSFKYVRYLAQNKFSEKYILNHKGVLTEAQAKAVLDSVDLSYKKTHEHSDLDTKTDKDEISKDFNELINIINTLAADGNIFFDKIIDNEFIKTINNEISSRQETNNINTIQRKKLRQSIQNELSDMGSADIDIDGNVKYNGEVKQEYRVDLVIGLPGSGKSSTVAIPLSEKYKSKIIDIDMVKEKLPEYDNGLGASAVHLESVKIAKEIMAKAVAKGDNIVYQFVGGGKSPNSIINKIKMFKNNGYSVYLHLCDVSNDVALGRALERYIQTGRYISPEIIKNYADTPSQNFDKIVNTTNLLDGYERHFNNQMTDKGELYYERESEQAKPTEPYNQDEKEIDGNDNGTASQADTIGGKFDGEAFKKSNKSIDGRGFDNGRIPGEGRSIPLQEAVTEIEQSEQSSLESDSVNGSVFYSQENKQEDVSSYEKSASHHENGALIDNGKNKYSYENLINKPDMEIAKLTKVSSDELKKYRANTSLFSKEMRDIAIKEGNLKNTSTSTYLYCEDLGGDILITKNSYKHGAERFDENYVAICKALPQVLKNAIVVNELKPRNGNEGSYVLLGMAEGVDGYNVIRLVINKNTWQLNTYEELYAIKKKTSAKSLPNYAQTSNKGQMSSIISISDFLALVNSQKIGSSVLSKDVIERLDSERITDENITPSLKYSMPTDFKTNKYSYENLINKPDMEIASIADVSKAELNVYENNRDLFAKDMRKIAESAKNEHNTQNSTYLYNKDMDIDVLISKDAYKHGAARMSNNYIAVCKVLPQIFKNAVCVNELVARENSNGSKVLLGLAESDTDYVVVRMVVENRTWKLSDYDILYAVQKSAIKKEDVGIKPPRYTKKGEYVTSSVISISDFLALVNSQKIGSSVLSKDVIERLDSERITDENITPSLKYSMPTDFKTNKYSYENLINKPDMEIAGFDNVTPNELKRYRNNTYLFAKEMRDIATGVGNKNNTSNITYLYNKDLDINVMISRDSYKHSAARMTMNYISVCKVLPQIFENAVCVNELVARENSNGSKVLLGLAESDTDYVVVRMVVENRTWKLSDYDILYAVQKDAIKKEDAGVKAPALHQKVNTNTSSTISISDFLALVNSQKIGSSVLSKDVIEHLDSKRITDENITPSLKYSIKQTSKMSYNEQLELIENKGLNGSNGEYDKASQQKNFSEELRFSFVEYAEDGKGKYKSNFPKGTPKSEKGKRILNLLQNVWSKSPIELNITDSNGNVIKTITAQFDPKYDETKNEFTDATKLMGGNRHGSSSEQRVTLDLADDYHKILSESKYNYSKKEIGKEKPTHDGVKEWHYFINEIYFAEYDSEVYEPYNVSINIKEKYNGSFVYSFSAEKSSEPSTQQTLHAVVSEENSANARPTDELNTPQTLHAAVNRTNSSANAQPDNILSDFNEKVNTDDMVTNNVSLSNSQIDNIVSLGRQLGRTVVVEDLRNRVVDGETVSPEGYIDGDGVIHINQYAKSPIAFIFKHELTHFCERSKLYSDFAKQVESSKLYKDWLCSKTGKKYLWDAEAVYKEQTLDSHTEIQSITDTNIQNARLQAEMIADFVGDFLFTDNGSGIASLISDVPVKQRPKIIQFLHDFVSYLKKKLSGNREVTLKLSRLEDSFNRMLSDATNGEYSDTKTDNIRYSIVGKKSKTADYSLLGEAIIMSHSGKSSEAIRKETGWYKGKDGKWRYYIPDNKLNIDKLVEFAKTSGETVLLGDCIEHKLLFDAYPELKNIKVEFKDLEPNNPGAYSPESDKIKLNNKYIGNTELLKDTLIHEMQHAIQKIESFAEGGNARRAYAYAVNLAYEIAHNSEQFKKITTKEEKLDYLHSIAQKLFNAKSLKEMVYNAYLNIYGEVEARQSENYRHFDENLLKLVEPNTTAAVVDFADEKEKFIENLTHIGYNKTEANNLIKKTGEISDQSGSIERTLRGDKPDSQETWGNNRGSVGRGSAEMALWSIRRNPIRISGNRRADKRIESTDKENERSSGNLGRTVQSDISGELLPGSRQHFTNGLGESKDIISDLNGEISDTVLSDDKIDSIIAVGKQLGRTVVVEDLRNRVVDGKTVSPEGYIDGDGVIHINQYAKSPIAFIFKHELTHFCERSKLYSDFAKRVESSKLYKDWLCYKTGKKYLWDAEAAYKAQTLDSHTEIQSITDTNIQNARLQAEMIADFVGDFLFTDNGRKIASLISDAPVKQRPKIIQFLQDFVSYLKKKLSGNREITFRLSMLEDSFNRMLSDATNGDYGDTKTDKEIAYCFVPCTDENIIKEAEIMEKDDALRPYIWRDLNVVRSPMGEWLYEINTSHYSFHARGDASTDKYFLKKFNATFEDASIKGYLGNFIRFKGLFEQCINLKAYKVVIEYNNENAVRLNHGERTFYIDKTLYDSFVENGDSEMKAQLLGEIQRALLLRNGTVDKNFDAVGYDLTEKHWQTFSKKLNRYMTTEEKNSNRPYEYLVNMVKERYRLNRKLLKSKRLNNVELKNYEKYFPSFEYDEIHLFDKHNNFISAREYSKKQSYDYLAAYPEASYTVDGVEVSEEAYVEKVEKERRRLEQERIAYETRTTDIDEQIVDEVFESNAKSDVLSKQNSEKLQEMLPDVVTASELEIHANPKIKIGDSGFFEQSFKETDGMLNELENASEREISGYDTAGRAIDKKLQKEFAKSVFKDINGNVASFFIHFKASDTVKDKVKSTAQFETFGGCLEGFFESRKKTPTTLYGTFVECYINSTSPYVTQHSSFDSFRILYELYENGKVSKEFYDKTLLLLKKSKRKDAGPAAEAVKDALRLMGCDSIVLVKSSKQSSVIPLSDDIVTVVSKNGLLASEEGELTNNSEQQSDGSAFYVNIVPTSKTRQDYSPIREKVNQKSGNTEKLKCLAEQLGSHVKKKGPQAMNRMRKVGSSGFFEKGKNIWRNGYLRLVQNIRANAKIALSDTDTAGRVIPDWIKRLPDNSLLKDGEGKPLSFFLFNRHGENRMRHNILGLHLGTFDNAVKRYDAENKAHPRSARHTIEEYYAAVKSPFYIGFEFDKFTPKKLAALLYEKGIIRRSEYNRFIKKKKVELNGSHNYNTRQIKRWLLNSGYDSIVYINQKNDVGALTLMVFDETALIPVSVNGLTTENNGNTVADSFEPAFLLPESVYENDKLSNFVEENNGYAVDLDKKRK